LVDIQAHILRGLDDGAKTWEQSLQIAQMRAEEGIKMMVATPHHFKSKTIDMKQFNPKK
jgi:protein-tyrosine phosphatase